MIKSKILSWWTRVIPAADRDKEVLRLILVVDLVAFAIVFSIFSLCGVFWLSAMTLGFVGVAGINVIMSALNLACIGYEKEN